MIFIKDYDHLKDNELVNKALNGNKAALSSLIKKNQDYIYNIALKLFLQPRDAQDATQEVLIKVITNLKSFRQESQFRTWLYRIVINHFLSLKSKKTELLMTSNSLITNENISTKDEEELAIDEVLVEEVRIMCSTAMLMCLERQQRLIYIIGEVFGADHNLGAELFNTSPGNYRIKLHRAKAQLLNFVSNKCGLVDQKNSCRCPKKTKQFMQEGIVDKNKIQFNTNYSIRINQLINKHKDAVSDTVHLDLKYYFQDSPFQVKDDLDKLLTNLLDCHS